MTEFMQSNILVLLLIIIIIMLSFKRSKKILIKKFEIFKEFFIKRLQVLLKNVIDYLSKVETILYKGNPVSNQLLLEDLTANLSNDTRNSQIDTYLDAVSFAINNENVTNIALTGGFGTGKSTIINEFCKSNRANEYLHISLASFKDDKSDEKLIETSIVQQILYYEKKVKIKESSYKRIDFTKPLRKLIFISLLSLWFYTLIFLFFEKINDKLVFFNKTKTNVQLIQFVFFVGVFYIFYKSYDKIKNIKLSKVTPNSLEIVNEKTDKDLSVFNRNIDEIIYFFEKTNTNIVIVEDIDRFNDDIAIKLYSKIRELSILIKQSKDVIQPVKFIYSVKDELILEDKTKFFDIIIPVIPIIDYSNSKNLFLIKLASFFEKENIEKENELGHESKSCLDKNFISEVSNYVYDMRTVINICNEFKLYNKILTVDKPNIELNKLFAIVFYKNIIPEDFAKIQKQTSQLHKIFRKDFDDNNLKKIISRIDDEIENKIKDRNKLKEESEILTIKDINELRYVYVFNLIAMIHKRHNVKVKAIEKIDLSYDLINEENFNKLKESTNIMFSYEYNPDYKSDISFKDLEDEVNIELSYDDREKNIKDFRSNKLALLDREINKLNHEKQNIQKLSFYELYENYNYEIENYLKTLYTEKVIKNENGQNNIEEIINPNLNLFKYLLKNDYLNEDFIEYASYFHLGSLSHNDYKLMIKINQNEITSFDEKIDDVENLVKNIRSIRFKNRSILTYEIFEFLLKNSHDNFRHEKLNFFIDQIENFNDDSRYFLEGYFNRIKDDQHLLLDFYDEIVKWNHFWNLVDTHFSEDLRRKVLFDLVILYSRNEIDNKVLVELNNDNRITYCINSDENFLKDILEKVKLKSFLETLILLDVKFERINSEEKIRDLLLKIYQNNLYQVNINNLKLFSQIDSLYNFNEDEFFNSNFTFLKSNIETSLFKRISENFNQYISYVYLKIEENVNEDSKEILYLLEQNDEKINLENKSKIIQKGFNGKLESFGNVIEKDIQTLLIEKNKIFASWKNILEYYSWESSFDPFLNNYLNDNTNYSNLSIIGLLNEQSTLFDNSDSCTDFIYKLVNNVNLSEDSFQTIFSESGELVLRSKGISIDSRILFLEEKTFFQLDVEEFDTLLEKNKDVLVKLIETYEDDFISDLDTYSFDIVFLEKLLESKLTIESLNAIIVEKEHDIIGNENLDFLKKISEFYVKNPSANFTSEMFEGLISSGLEEKYVIAMFNLAYSDENNNYDITDILSKMGDKFTDIINEENVSFDVNSQNETFLKILEENNIISSFIKNKKEKIYTTVYDD